MILLSGYKNKSIENIVDYLNNLVINGELRFNPIVYKDNPENNPLCPDCKIPMKFRTSRFGNFYGCPNYPKCSRKLHIN